MLLKLPSPHFKWNTLLCAPPPKDAHNPSTSHSPLAAPCSRTSHAPCAHLGLPLRQHPLPNELGHGVHVGAAGPRRVLGVRRAQQLHQQAVDARLALPAVHVEWMHVAAQAGCRLGMGRQQDCGLRWRVEGSGLELATLSTASNTHRALVLLTQASRRPACCGACRPAGVHSTLPYPNCHPFQPHRPPQPTPPHCTVHAYGTHLVRVATW